MTKKFPALKWLEVIERESGGKTAALRHALRKTNVEFVDVEAGEIKVKLSRGKQKPCFIKISREVLPESLWQAVLQEMAREAGCAAALAAGEWPDGAEKIFKRHGAVIFPRSLREFKTQCSAEEEVSEICRHALWAHVLFAERLEEDPRLLFDFLGKSSAGILEHLKSFQTIKKADPFESSSHEVSPAPENVLGWQGTAAWARTLPHESESAFEMLKTSPWRWKGKDLRDVLIEISQRVQTAAKK